MAASLTIAARDSLQALSKLAEEADGQCVGTRAFILNVLCELWGAVQALHGDDPLTVEETGAKLDLWHRLEKLMPTSPDEER